MNGTPSPQPVGGMTALGKAVLTLLVLGVVGFGGWKWYEGMQKTAYEMRISDWSSDVCSSDLNPSDSFTSSFTLKPHFRKNHEDSLGAVPPLAATRPA